MSARAGDDHAAPDPPADQRERSRDEPWLTPFRLVALSAVLVSAYAAVVIVQALRGVLIMLLVALFLSFSMEPAVQFLARRGWRRGLATGAVFVAVVLAVVGTLAAFIPMIVEQVTGLLRMVPQSIEEVNELLQRSPFDIDLEASPQLRTQIAQWTADLEGQLRDVALGAAGNVVDIGATFVGLFVRALAVGLITFFLVADGPRLRRTLARPLPPERQRELLAVWELAVAKTGGYVYSRLLIGASSAAAHTAFLLFLGVPFALPLGLWMGLMTALVPLIGVELGGIVLVLVSFVHEPIAALWVFLFMTGYQLIENYVLAPKVQAHTMDLHPAVAFVSVLVGGSLLGVVGALLALPAAAITKALLSTYVRRHELIDELAHVQVPGIATDEPVMTGGGQGGEAAGGGGTPDRGEDAEAGQAPERGEASEAGAKATSSQRRSQREITA